MPGIDVAAASAAHVAGGVLARHDDAFHLLRVDGQQVVLVTQKRYRLAGHGKGRRVAFGVVERNGAVALSLVVEAHANHSVEDVSHLRFDVVHREFTLRDVQAKAVGRHVVGTGHLEVEAAIGCSQTVVRGAPVAHDDAFVAPTVAQNVGKQSAAMCRVDAVHEVVAAHQASRLAFLHSGFEGGEVDFVQRPLVHVVADAVAVVVGVVAEEVLDGRRNAFPLGADDVVGGCLPCQIGVLAHVLEVASAEGRAIDVDAWAEDDVDAAGAAIACQGATVALGHVAVPCGSKCLIGRISRCYVVRADALRAVAHLHARDVEAVDVLCMIPVRAAHHRKLLVVGHQVEQRIDHPIDVCFVGLHEDGDGALSCFAMRGGEGAEACCDGRHLELCSAATLGFGHVAVRRVDELIDIADDALFRLEVDVDDSRFARPHHEVGARESEVAAREVAADVLYLREVFVWVVHASGCPLVFVAVLREADVVGARADHRAIVNGKLLLRKGLRPLAIGH